VCGISQIDPATERWIWSIGCLAKRFFFSQAVALHVILPKIEGSFKTDENLGEKPYFLY
jgi:hypothetical protein